MDVKNGMICGVGGGRFLLDPELGAAECLQPHSQTETTDSRMGQDAPPISCERSERRTGRSACVTAGKGAWPVNMHAFVS